MAVTAIIPIRMGEIMRNITLQVRIEGEKRAAVRRRLGLRLLRLAAWVMGCGIEVSTGPAPIRYNDDGTPRNFDVGHPNYDHNIGHRLKVFLNGVEQDKVVAYDMDAGTVQRWDGGFHGGDHRLVTDRGIVTASWRDEE